MTHPLVSIIIPTYNRASIILTAVASVEQQTFTDYEIIVVDDGGSDDTRGLLESRHNDKIIYLRKETNQGLAAARNTGMQAARGEYLAFLDDDDAWLPEKLALQIPILQQNPATGMVHCGYTEIDEHGRVLRRVQPDKKGRVYHRLLYYNNIVLSGVVVRKGLAARVGCFDENLSGCADWDLWLRIARCCDIDFVDAPLVTYRIHSDNMHKNIHGMETDTFRILEKHAPDMPALERNRIYSEHAIIYARQYYRAGNMQDCKRLLHTALTHDPLMTILVPEATVREREKTARDVFSAFWKSPEGRRHHASRNKAYAQQYHQLAWEYYHQGALSDFRRCVAAVFKYSFPRLPCRLLIPYGKSLLGKHASEAIHAARKHFMPGRPDRNHTP